MKVIETPFKDLFVLEPKVLGDSRGYFMESFSKRSLHDAGIKLNFVQDNQSSSTKGVLRGLHFQRPPFAQTKLVRVLRGLILDVVVDIRKSEPTFGKNFSIELSAENKKQLLIPKGFAHGFIVLSEEAEVFYKVDQYYNAQADAGLLFNDPTLKIDWRLPSQEFILSEKDKKHPLLSELGVIF
jgi:dTDP-4-dehydrorhamnose 3,5-epimerase